MNEYESGQEATPRFMEAWKASFRHTLWVHSWWTSVAVTLLAINSTFPTAHKQGDYPQKPAAPPPTENMYTPASPDVLWEAKEKGKVVVLDQNQDCPEGGIGLDDTLIALKNSEPTKTGPALFALQAARVYIMSAAQGDFLVFCGPDAGQGMTAFDGNAVIASGVDVSFTAVT